MAGFSPPRHTVHRAYGFLISERETIPPLHAIALPCPIGSQDLVAPGRSRQPALSDNYQPIGSVAACRTAHPKLDCNDASTADRRHRRQIAAMPMLRSSNGQARGKPYDAVRLRAGMFGGYHCYGWRPIFELHKAPSWSTPKQSGNRPRSDSRIATAAAFLQSGTFVDDTGHSDWHCSLRRW